MLNRSRFSFASLSVSLVAGLLAGVVACTPPSPTDPGGPGTGGSASTSSGSGGTPSSSGSDGSGGTTGTGGSASSGSGDGSGGSAASTGGTTGTGGSATGGSASGGSNGTSEPVPTTPPADAGSADTAAPSATPPSDGKTFDCTLVIGIAATGQWFNAGFEKMVDNNKWELLAVHSGFVQSWADPNSDFWSKSPSSACTANAKTPDRVILTALYLHWMEATVDQWVEVLTKTVMTFKAKNPNLKRLELATFVRSPGGKPCQAAMTFKSFIKPEQDEAFAKIAAMFPDLVTVAPKFEVRTCADFGGNPPHFSGAGAMAAAKLIADHYKQ